MKTRVQKWGNSLTLRIPKTFASKLGLDPNAPVEISLRDEKLIVRPSDKPKFTLKGLLAKVTEENRHEEVNAGPTVSPQQSDQGLSI